MGRYEAEMVESNLDILCVQSKTVVKNDTNNFLWNHLRLQTETRAVETNHQRRAQPQTRRLHIHRAGLQSVTSISIIFSTTDACFHLLTTMVEEIVTRLLRYGTCVVHDDCCRQANGDNDEMDVTLFCTHGDSAFSCESAVKNRATARKRVWTAMLSGVLQFYRFPTIIPHNGRIQSSVPRYPAPRIDLLSFGRHLRHI